MHSNPERVWRSDRNESSCGTSLSRQDSKLPNKIKASGQPVKNGALTLKSECIQNEGT